MDKAHYLPIVSHPIFQNGVQLRKYGFSDMGNNPLEFEIPVISMTIGQSSYILERDNLLAILSDIGIFTRRRFFGITERLQELLPENERVRPEILLEDLVETGHIMPDYSSPSGKEKFRVI